MMDANSSPLQRLLHRIQEGSEEASAEIYEEYVPYLRIVVRRHITHELRAKFDSLDVVQSVWADLLDGLRRGRWTFDSPNHLRAFLVRATRNRLVDYVRHHESGLRVQTRLSDENALPAKQPKPSAEARANEKWNEIMRRCSASHRAIVEMKRDGCSLTEIAQQTGYHPSSIRRILYSLENELGES